jgi:outer membrane lipase/esterase
MKARLTLKNIVLLAIILVSSRFGQLDAAVIGFGDSLSDTGNFKALTDSVFAPNPGDVNPIFDPVPGARFPTPPFFGGRASNGPVWLERLAQRLGEPTPLPSLLGGNNFSFIGATTGAVSSGFDPMGFINLPSQVTQYLTRVGGVVPTSGDLFVVWAGANDWFFSFDDPSGPVDPFVAASSVLEQMSRLAVAGASDFLLVTVPLLGETPAFVNSPLSAAANSWTTVFNDSLLAGLSNPTLNHSTIHVLDVENFVQTAADAGFTNTMFPSLLVDPVTGAAVGPPYTLLNDPNTSVHWDLLHPTAGVHELVGDLAFRAVVPEPASLAVWTVLGLAVSIGSVRHRRRATLPGAMRC